MSGKANLECGVGAYRGLNANLLACVKGELVESGFGAARGDWKVRMVESSGKARTQFYIWGGTFESVFEVGFISPNFVKPFDGVYSVIKILDHPYRNVEREVYLDGEKIDISELSMEERLARFLSANEIRLKYSDKARLVDMIELDASALRANYEALEKAMISCGYERRSAEPR